MEEPMAVESWCLSMNQVEPQDINKLASDSFKSGEFWLKKGFLASQNEDKEMAIDYYLQGLIYDSKNIDLMYNLGCLYNNLNKLKSSMYYLSKAYLKNVRDVKWTYGICIVLHRLEEFSDSQEYVYTLLRNKSISVSTRINLMFIKAMNYKRLENYHKASKSYIKFIRALENNKKIDTREALRCTWGLLMTPLIDDRSNLLY